MNKCKLLQKAKRICFDEIIEYNPEKKLLKKQLSFWCLVDTDIVFLINLCGYRALLLQTTDNWIFVSYFQLPITFLQ